MASRLACFSSVYFAQGLAYPVSPLTLKLLRFSRGADGFQATALVAGLTVALWSVLMWRAGRSGRAFLSLGWYALMAAPVWATLQFEYVQESPRLLYGAAIGAALFWAIPVDLRFLPRWRLAAARGAAALVVAGGALGGYRFIRGRVPLYQQMESAAAELHAAVRAGGSMPLLCVNYPLWLAREQPGFATGHEGVIVVYSNVGDLLWVHTGQEWPARNVVFIDLLPERWRFLFACLGPFVTGDTIQEQVRWARQVVVARYEDGNIAVCDAGGLEGVRRPAADTYLAAFDGRLALLSAACERRGATVHVELRWQCWHDVGQEATVFLHLYDEGRQLVAQADGYPVMGTSRLVAWQPGDEWRDVRYLRLPEGLATGRDAIKVGLYPVLGGPRLAAVGPEGERFQDDSVPIATLVVP